jgi:hypothetical protein
MRVVHSRIPRGCKFADEHSSGPPGFYWGDSLRIRTVSIYASSRFRFGSARSTIQWPGIFKKAIEMVRELLTFFASVLAVGLGFILITWTFTSLAMADWNIGHWPAGLRMVICALGVLVGVITAIIAVLRD